MSGCQMPQYGMPTTPAFGIQTRFDPIRNRMVDDNMLDPMRRMPHRMPTVLPYVNSPPYDAGAIEFQRVQKAALDYVAPRPIL